MDSANTLSRLCWKNKYLAVYHRDRTDSADALSRLRWKNKYLTASVASPGLRYHEYLALAQHFSVLCHRMLSAYQDECHWLQHPQQIGWWTMIECRPGQQIGWIVAVLGVQELSGGSQPRFLHEAAQSSMNNGFWHPVCFVDGTGLLNNWSSPNVHANQQPC